MEAITYDSGTIRNRPTDLKSDIRVFFKDDRINSIISDISEYSYERAMKIRRDGQKSSKYLIFNKMALFYLLKPSRLESFEKEYYQHYKSFISESTGVIFPNAI